MNKISRRSVIGGMSAAVATPWLAASALASEPIRKAAVSSAPAARVTTPGFATELDQRFNQSAVTLLDGRILITGGYGANPALVQNIAPTAGAFIYDPRSGEAVIASDMQVPRARHASVLLRDGRVAVLGGVYWNALDSIEIYDPSQNRWTFAPKMPLALCDHTACLAADGYLFIAGGATGNGGIVLSIGGSPILTP